jgi:hypothetical protein
LTSLTSPSTSPRSPARRPQLHRRRRPLETRRQRPTVCTSPEFSHRWALLSPLSFLYVRYWSRARIRSWNSNRYQPIVLRHVTALSAPSQTLVSLQFQIQILESVLNLVNSIENNPHVQIL